ncbi:hypothetical protein, partial [Paraburkholderia fungorum]|uniref:hypothetical protein n=1 Tax=Paraburkholderia fungorum TaxID=134537 RepID=UPI00241E0CDB
SSAHTYRLLIFKDRVRIHYRIRTVLPTCATTGTASFCVAASAAEKRDYGDRLPRRQPPSANFLLGKYESTPELASFHGAPIYSEVAKCVDTM